MNSKFFFTFLLFTFLITRTYSQEKFTLSGIITDSKSNETLIGVNLYIPELKTGATTNEYGFYSITVPKGTYNFQLTYLGFQTVEQNIILNKNTKANFKLNSLEEQLMEVIVNSNKNTTNTRKAEMSVNKLSIGTINRMPVVLGEVDVLKSLLLLPGVTSVGEGASGFNVRGGGAVQNL